MKPQSLLLLFPSLVFLGCQPDAAKTSFDKQKWNISENGNYPYREQMVDAVITSRMLEQKTGKQVLKLLGEPTRTDGSYWFYGISRSQIGSMTLHTKTLVLIFSDGRLAKALIHS